MQRHRYEILFILFLLICHSPLSAQFGGGRGGDSANGLIGVASSARPGRVITVGGRLTPYRKLNTLFP